MAPGYYWAKNTFKQDLEGESEAAASHVYPRKGQRWVTHVGADLLAHLRTTQGHNSSSNYQILFQLLWVPSQMCIQLHSKSHWLYHIGHVNIETGGDERQLWVPVWVPVLPPVWQMWVPVWPYGLQFIVSGSGLSLLSPTSWTAFFPDCWLRHTSTSCPTSVTETTHINLHFHQLPYLYNKSLFSITHDNSASLAEPWLIHYSYPKWTPASLLK